MRRRPKPLLDGADRPLRLITGGASPDPKRPLVERGAIDVAIRAGERHEPWTIAFDEGLAQLAEEARRLRVEVGVAVRLVVECQLVLSELARRARVELAALDASAAGAEIAGELEGAASAYIRRLLRPDAREDVELTDPLIVALPMRLSTRLLAADLPELMRAEHLARARAWEIAALAEGMTMSEWAAWTALGAVATGAVATTRL
jgi:hypothetical protein